jgi:hypothetical protein
MTTDQPVHQPGDAAAPASGERPPDWWHRDHPTFTALSGFFGGLAFVILVPGLFAAVLNWIFEYHTAENLFPLVLVTLAVPIGLVSSRRSRRFGLYMVVGMVTTLLVVAGVSALVLWYMFQFQG